MEIFKGNKDTPLFDQVMEYMTVKSKVKQEIFEIYIDVILYEPTNHDPAKCCKALRSYIENAAGASLRPPITGQAAFCCCCCCLCPQFPAPLPRPRSTCSSCSTEALARDEIRFDSEENANSYFVFVADLQV